MRNGRLAILSALVLAVNVLIGVSLGLAVNVASAAGRWPGVLDLIRQYPWAAVGVIAAISVLGLLMAAAVDRRRESQPAETKGEQVRLQKGVVRPFICPRCSRMRLMRLAHGEAGFVTCPRCAARFTITMQADGKMRCELTDRAITYYARFIIPRFYFILSEIFYEDRTLGETKPVTPILVLCPKCRHAQSVYAVRGEDMNQKCEKCASDFSARYVSDRCTVSSGAHKRISYRARSYLNGYVHRISVLGSEPDAIESRP